MHDVLFSVTESTHFVPKNFPRKAFQDVNQAQGFPPKLPKAPRLLPTLSHGPIWVASAAGQWWADQESMHCGVRNQTIMG